MVLKLFRVVFLIELSNLIYFREFHVKIVFDKFSNSKNTLQNVFVQFYLYFKKTLQKISKFFVVF